MQNIFNIVLDGLSYIEPPLKQDFYRYGFGGGLAGLYFTRDMANLILGFVFTYLLSPAALPFAASNDSPFNRSTLSFDLHDFVSGSTSSGPKYSKLTLIEEEVVGVADKFLALAPTILRSPQSYTNSKIGEVVA